MTSQPPSFAQQRLWFLDRLLPGSSLYSVPAALRLRGPLDAGALSWALDQVVARHDVLRSGFALERDELVVRIEPALEVAMPVDDLAGLAAGERARRARAAVRDAAWRPFSLTEPPLLRARLLRLGEEDHVFVLAVHHAVFDGASEEILFAELSRLYAARLLGDPPDLPALAAQYGDFARAQREAPAEELLRRDLAFWTGHLAGAPGVLDLPADRPRPAVVSLRGGVHRFALPGSEWGAALAAARGWRVSPFMATLAAFAGLLVRYSGADDLVIGTPVDVRPPASEALIGLFANTLPLRVDAGGDPTLGELAARVRAVVLEAFEHRDAPLERMVEAMQPDRSLSHNPLFQVLFTCAAAPRALPRLPGIRVTALDPGTETAKFDLSLSLEPVAAGAAGRLEHARDLFDARTAARMAGHYRRLLRGSLARPDARLSQLPLLGSEERRQAVVVPARPDPAPAWESLPALIRARAARTPDAVCLQCGDAALTYRELMGRVSATAAELVRNGVGPDVRVGVLLDRSSDLVVALLAVLEAGGAYVPVDPAYPPRRIAFMLRDSGAAVLITEPGLPADLAPTGTPLVRVAASGTPPAAPASAPHGESLAYVIYTSGSTGVPKGVAVTHASLANLLQSMQDHLGLGREDRWGAVTSVSFDIAALEVFLPLVTGARLVLYDAAVARDPGELARRLQRDGVTVLQSTPSLWGLLVDAGPLPPLTALCGGEPLPEPLARALRARVHSLWNVYGPTETTIWSTAGLVDSERVWIGAPLARTRLLVLDEALEPVPAGVWGELCIAGRGLARGYLGRPGLTAGRFVPDARAGLLGERLYRTGDVARLRVDGTIELRGRTDHQVKLRGYRVELGEVEAALRDHPDVAAAAATVPAPTHGQLVAHVVPRPGRTLDVAEVKRFLRERLPEYMVPSFVLPLAALPLTGSGKVDRARLPLPEAVEEGARSVAPRTTAERTIAGIWCAALGLRSVGIDDNFFDAGGHSMLLVAVQRELARAFEAEVPLTLLFQRPTVRSLADHFAGGRQDAEPGPARAEPGPGGAGRAVAIVGMAGRFAGAGSLEAFWEGLCAGVEYVRTLGREELSAAGVDEAALADPAYVPRRGVLDGIELFDAQFFDVPPREAEMTDPQHRLFLECAWEALEDAGLDPERFPGAVGVFASASTSTYHERVLAHRGLARVVGATPSELANDLDYLATRVSYKLNLRGPSIAVQTACSSALVALHVAVRALLAGDCDAALAGAASIQVPQGGHHFREGGIASPDGRCRAFDADAAGTVGGSGVGAVVLKRLDDAMAHGDHVYAVVLGTAVNNDGSGKVGFTAPGPDGQAAVIAAAQAAAGVPPRSITYVEAHGTGTPLGDPVEVKALTRAFRAGTPDVGFCALGSVKTNVGHLDAAAGMAGLIKAALAIHHGRIPPSLHFASPNPACELERSPFAVSTELRDWRSAGLPRRAGVSSFGLGGTNAHAVLEEAPPAPAVAPARPGHVLVLSARTPGALAGAVAGLAEHLERHPEADLADVAHTLRVGRRRFEHRAALVCADLDEAVAALRGRSGRLVTGQPAAAPPVVFLLPGQGAQHADMGRGLYEHEPPFREWVDRCCELLEPHLGLDLRARLYAAAPDPELDQTRLAQPALFVTAYALARTLMAWGVRPDAMIGHSLGEYVAACLAGVLGLEDALALVALRGRLMQDLPAGAMLGVALGEDELRRVLPPELALAAINGPRQCVASGPAEAIAGFRERLDAARVRSWLLRTSHAFHSPVQERAAGPLAAALAGLPLRAPELRYASNLTGDWITPATATDPGCWARQMVEPVRFAHAVRLAVSDPAALLLEVGPGAGLSALARQRADRGRVVAAMRHPDDATPDRTVLLGALARLWVAGVPLDWEAFGAGERRRIVSLPRYPFERQRYWIEPAPSAPVPSGATAVAANGGGHLTAYPRPASLDSYVEPRSETERRVADIWRDLIGTDRIGATDDFFELGGSSLIATQLMARLDETFGVDLPVRVVFERPTVAGLAVAIEDRLIEEIEAEVPDGD